MSTERKPRCRYIVRTGKLGTGVGLDRCTGEVAEDGAEIELCQHHLANALALLQRRLGPAAGTEQR